MPDWDSVSKPVAARPAPLPTSPQPFPGAKPIVLTRPVAKVQSETIAANRDVRDANADARAAELAEIAKQRAALDAEKAARDRATAAETGGVDRTAQETTAAGHMQTLAMRLDLINNAIKQDPNAAKPGFLEAALGGTVNSEFKGALRSGQRQVVSDSYGPILESAVYLATGAAANDDQVKRLAAGLVPTYTDKPEALKAKAIALEAELAKAASIAGPAGIKAREYLGQVRKLYPLMYGISADEVDNPLLSNSANAPKVALSGDSQQVPIPPEMQAELNQFLKQNPPGSLTPEKFLDFYTPLFQKYDFGGPENLNQQAAQFVAGYNTGKANTTIPNPSEKLEGLEAGVASAAADPGLMGDIYTGTARAANAFSLGIPELLSGREGRAALDQASAEHPKSAMTGEIAGSLIPAIAAEKAGTTLGRAFIKSELGQKILGEVAGNAAYGGVRGATGAEPGDRLSSALTDAAIGGGSALAARGAIEGAPGFLGVEKQGAIDSLKGSAFEIPAGRGALPADEITPPRYQAMGDDELRAEVARTERAIDAHGTQTTLVQQNQQARQSILDEAKQVAAGNANRQEKYVRENFRSTQPDAIDAIRRDAEQMFPTDPNKLLEQPAFADRLAAIKDPSMEGVEPIGILQARAERLNSYLAQDATPKTGKIAGVDMTTPQRIGMGEAEESLQGLPFVHGQRESSQASYNKFETAKVLSKIGQELPDDIKAGTDLHAYTNNKLNEAYTQIRPSIKGKVDQPFNNAIAALRKQGTTTDEMKKLWGDIESTLANFRRPDGSFDGEGYRELSVRMRRYSDQWSNNNNPNTTVASQDAARLAEQVRKQAQALVSRSNPAVGRRLKTIESAWAKQMRLEAASTRAVSSGGVYSPDELLGEIRRLDTSRNKGAVARGQALGQKEAQDARTVLGGKPAKKSSLQTTALAGFLLSKAGPLGLAVTGAAGAGYTPGVKRVMQGILEGKLGKTPQAVEEALGKSAAGRTILKATGSDARRRILTQMLRANTSE